MSPEEREAMLVDSIIAALLPALLPHTLKRKRSVRKPKDATTGEG